MNILLLSTHLSIGGIASYVAGVARELKRKGHKVIVSSSGGVVVEGLEKESIPHIRLDIRTKSELSPKLLLALPRLLSLVKREDIEIIHAHTRITQVLASLVSHLSGVPYVATCHGFFKKRLGRRIFKCWGDRTIAISDAVKRHLMNDFKVPKEKIELIYNGVDVKKFKKEFSEDEKHSLRSRFGLKDGMVIGAIGRLSPVKGYEYLIRAFALLLEKYKDLQLLIVGDGPQKNELQNVTRRLKIEKKLRFTEPQLDTVEPLCIMDIFVSSSVQEGLGLSLVEALASKRPVVATDVGGVSSLVKNRRTGLLANPRDSSSLARAISSLLKDSRLRSRLGREGCKWVEEEFTISNMVNKIEQVYTKVSRLSLDTNRILIVNVNWLGDVLFTTPFIKAIRKKYPRSFIACMAMPRCKQILEDCPYLDEIIIYDQDGEHKSILGKLKIIKELKKRRFDKAFLLHRSFTRALITFLSGIKIRVGYNTKRRGFLLTKALEEPPLNTHKVEYFLNIASKYGAETDDKSYEFFVRDSDRERMNDFLRKCGVKGDNLLVVLNPGGNWPPKRWPKERFAKLTDRLSDELGAKIVITGAPKDFNLARDIVALSRARPINAAGSTSIGALAALMDRADLVVSSDSGPMHIAVGIKAKVIALFGPTSDSVTGPYGNGNYAVIKKRIECAIPCYNFNCRDYRCMKAITVDEVFEKAKEMLDENR